MEYYVLKHSLLGESRRSHKYIRKYIGKSGKPVYVYRSVGGGRSREKNVSGTSVEVSKKGNGLGTGPVGDLDSGRDVDRKVTKIDVDSEHIATPSDSKYWLEDVPDESKRNIRIGADKYNVNEIGQSGKARKDYFESAKKIPGYDDPNKFVAENYRYVDRNGRAVRYDSLPTNTYADSSEGGNKPAGKSTAFRYGNSTYMVPRELTQNKAGLQKIGEMIKNGEIRPVDRKKK